VVRGAARDEGVVLDAVEVRALLQEQVELLVAGMGKERAHEARAQRRLGDVHAALADRVHRDHRLHERQLRGREAGHVLARARHPEAEAGQGSHGQPQGGDGIEAMGQGDVGQAQGHAEHDLRGEADEAALLGPGQDVDVGQRRTHRRAKVLDQVLLEDLLARGVVVRPGTAPRVVVRHQHQPLQRVAGHREDVVVPGGSPRERAQALALDQHHRLALRMLAAGGRASA
jgi:hypothetical protein